ncbi:unnamed protein product [Amoebophrya sp. A25]|nr:unnamed protein product [Amoebophrya sp. A25]|eukprot:GSA25T00005854001.1
MMDLVTPVSGAERRAKEQGSNSGDSYRQMDGITSPCKCARHDRKRT